MKDLYIMKNGNFYLIIKSRVAEMRKSGQGLTHFLFYNELNFERSLTLGKRSKRFSRN